MHQSVVKPTIETFDIDLNKYIFLTSNIDLEFLALCLAGHRGHGGIEMKNHFGFFLEYKIKLEKDFEK